MHVTRHREQQGCRPAYAFVIHFLDLTWYTQNVIIILACLSNLVTINPEDSFSRIKAHIMETEQTYDHRGNVVKG